MKTLKKYILGFCVVALSAIAFTGCLGTSSRGTPPPQSQPQPVQQE